MQINQQLHQQIHNITELNNVLTSILAERSLCDSAVTSELFYRYIDAVKNHLHNTENAVFAQLLVNANEEQTTMVEKFIDGSHEINLIFNRYSKRWCKNNRLNIKNYAEFYQDTLEVFDLVLRRLRDETEKLFPLVNQTIKAA